MIKNIKNVIDNLPSANNSLISMGPALSRGCYFAPADAGIIIEKLINSGIYKDNIRGVPNQFTWSYLTVSFKV